MLKNRRSIRLPGYDYSTNGAYFVTVCAHKRFCLFGNVIEAEMILNEYGKTIGDVWLDLPNHYRNLVLDEWVIMPNHIHGIVLLRNDDAVGAGLKPAPTKRHGLPEILRAFKTFSSRRINRVRRTPGASVWQRSYFDRIIRSDEEFNRIREYVLNNPKSWDMDHENPDADTRKPNSR